VCLSPICQSLDILPSISVCLSVCLSLSVCLPASLSVCLSACLSFSLPLPLTLPLYLFISLFLSLLSLSLSLSLSFSLCLSLPLSPSPALSLPPSPSLSFSRSLCGLLRGWERGRMWWWGWNNMSSGCYIINYRQQEISWDHPFLRKSIYKKHSAEESIAGNDKYASLCISPSPSVSPSLCLSTLIFPSFLSSFHPSLIYLIIHSTTYLLNRNVIHSFFPRSLMHAFTNSCCFIFFFLSFLSTFFLFFCLSFISRRTRIIRTRRTATTTILTTREAENNT